MITTHKGRTYEIFLSGTIAAPSYYAHTHCWCGSTLGSGEWWPTIERAIAESESNIADHEKRDAHAKHKPCPSCLGILGRIVNTCGTCSGRGRVAVKP